MYQPFRDNVLAREVTDLKPLSFSMCHAYGAHTFEAQDENHDYEVIPPLGNSPPLPPVAPPLPWRVVASTKTFQKVLSDTATTLLSAGEPPVDGEHHYEPTCAPSSVATPTETTTTPTETTATPTETTTTPTIVSQ